MSEQLTDVINKLEQGEFWQTLIPFIDTIVTANSKVVMLFNRGSLPAVQFNQVKEKQANAFDSIYMRGAYVLSPLFQCHKRNRAGCFHLSEIAPDSFYQSEYYFRYYAMAGLTDQLALIVPVDTEMTIAISLGLLSGSFDESEVSGLKQHSELIATLVQKHWQLSQYTQVPLNEKLQTAFELFGSSVLTEQEQKVVQLIMKGHSSKSSANELGISPQTERSYRKSAYSKLMVNSQAELFNLFFACIGNIDNSLAQDPLLLNN